VVPPEFEVSRTYQSEIIATVLVGEWTTRGDGRTRNYPIGTYLPADLKSRLTSVGNLGHGSIVLIIYYLALAAKCFVILIFHRKALLAIEDKDNLAALRRDMDDALQSSKGEDK
jgi:hypothetical protein